MPEEVGPSAALSPASNVPWPVRWALVALAIVSLALAVLGLFLPLVPTVPFVLLAAWAAARGSPRLAGWMERHRWMGPHIVSWRNGGVVRRSAKWTASALMGLSAITMLLVLHPHWLSYLIIACMGVVLAWLWRRPEKAPR